MASAWPARIRAFGRLFSVAGHVLSEFVLPAKARFASDVPSSHLDITPAWLTAVLCKNVRGARVLDFKAMGGSVGTSTRQGLQLILNDAALEAGVPLQLFTKSSTQFNQRLMLGLSGMINGEIGFYPQIRPQLNIEAPLGYHACLDPESWRSMVLMEDVVASRGAAFMSTETKLSQGQMEDLLTNMARWHGCFWNSPQLKRELAWLRSPADFLSAIVPLGFRYLTGKGIELASSVIPEELKARTNEAWKALAVSFEMNKCHPRTLLHGDPHIGQTYLTRDGRMGYADWQLVMQGGWSFDFAYAMISSLTIDDRQRWERDLLRLYLDCLHASGGPRLAIEPAWLSYRQNAIYPYFCWLMTITGSHLPLVPNMQPKQTSLDIIERSAAAICDLNSIDVLLK